jgi:iron complex outermembrane receptor protein
LATEIRVIYKSAMLAGVAGLALASAALAQAPKLIQFDIPPEDLGTALNEVARQSHQEVIFNADLTRGKQAPALRGDFDTGQALQQLLTGTNLSAKLSPNGSFVVERGGPLAFATTDGTPPVPAQDIATVTVTGTRIVRDGYSAPTPVTVAPIAELEQTTPSDIADALNKLPEFSSSVTQASNGNALAAAGNFLNLRGLGVPRTLVLMNGARVPGTSSTGTVDTNTLPQLLVQRVDVVTGGASAIYGSDAVGGVVNYILDTKFNGFKGVAQTGLSTYGDVPSQRLGFAMGMPVFSAGHFVFSYEHHAETGLSQGDRSSTNVYPAYTGAGTAANPYTLTNNTRLATTTFGGYVTSGPFKGQQFVGGGTLAPFTAGATTGSANLQVGGDGAYYYDLQLLKPLRTDQLFGRFDYDFDHNISAFIQVSAGLSQSTFAGGSSVLSTTIYANNAYLPANAVTALGKVPSFTMSSLLQNLALQGRVIEKTQSIDITTGLEGKLFNDDFRWSAYYAHGEGLTRADNQNNINSQHLYAALDAVKDPNSGNIVCNVSLTPNASLYLGCVPLNIFGVGNESQAALNYIYQDTIWRVVNKIDDVSATISGSAFNDWAGPVSLASNFEYRNLSLSQTTNADPTIAPILTGLRTTWVGATPTTPFLSNTASAQSGTESVWEISGETVVPLIKDMVLAKNLEFSGAARYTNYTTSGSVVTWKAGLSYQPVNDLRFRATRSRDIRAPNLYELFQSASFGQTTITLDPHTGTGGTVKTESVGNPNLQPETATTNTVGLIYSPSWLPPFRISVDYYDIDIENVIGTTTGLGGPSTALSNCEASGGTSVQCTAIVRPLPFSNTTAANFPTLIVTESINLAKQYTQGVDIQASYNVNLATLDTKLSGQLDTRVIFNYMPKQITVNSPGAVPTNAAGSSLPTTRLTAMLNYKVGPFSASWQTNYSGRHNQGTGAQGQVFAGGPLPAIVTDDLNLSYRFKAWGGDLQSFLTINNLFNQPPQISPGVSSVPGSNSPASGDVIGRYFTVGVRFTF